MNIENAQWIWMNTEHYEYGWNIKIVNLDEHWTCTMDMDEHWTQWIRIITEHYEYDWNIEHGVL